MPTVSDFIHSSFRLIGAIAAGEILETNELNDALISLNQMLMLWNTEGASVPSRQQYLTGVNPSSNSYPLSFHPIRIESASIFLGQVDAPLAIVDSTGWEATPEKQALTVYVEKLYCDYAYPTSTVYIAPRPRLSGVLEMWVYLPMQPFTDLNQVIDMPPGYEQGLRYGFAVALLPEYPRSQVDPTLVPQAQAFKASLQQLNSQNFMRSQMNSPAQAATADAGDAVAR